MKVCLLLSLLGLAGLAVGRRGNVGSSKNNRYKGTYVGKMKTIEHKVTGHVYCIDNTTIYIEGFTYDGEAPDAYFFAGNNSEEPTNRGFIIPDERARKEVLGPYSNKNLVLKFPKTAKKGQRSFSDIKWISVWCRRFAIDFGHVLIPPGMKIPAPQQATGLSSDKPLVSSSSVTLLDTNTIELEDFIFDGTVQDAIFVVGSGDPSSSGAQVTDERGSSQPLSKYSRRTLRLDIPEEYRSQPVQYFGVWSPTKGMLASVTFDTSGRVPPAISSLV